MIGYLLYVGASPDWCQNLTQSLAVAQSVLGTLTVNMDLSVRTSAALKNQTLVTPPHADPTPFAQSTVLETPFAGKQ